jgi:tRNA G18 (ribose-2'-O)-methylase SpoU
MIGSMIEIHDAKDPRIGVFLNQKDAWLKAAHNPETDSSAQYDSADGLFIAEGVLVVEQLIHSKFPVHSVLVTTSRAKNIAPVLDQVPAGVPIYVASQEIIDEIVGFPMHRGLLACGKRLPNPDPIELARGCRAMVVMEDLSNHDNVGSVFRSVAALGGEGVGVWMTKRCCDPLYRKSLRVSMGHVLRVPFAMVDDLGSGLDELSRLGFTSIALTPGVDSITIDESLDRGIDRPALLFGAEGPGLSEQILEKADQKVRIAMSKDVDSLNIAVSAAVSMHRYFTPA